MVFDLRSRDHISKATIMSKVENGELTSSYNDTWYRNMAFFNRFPRLYALAENQQSRVCDYSNETGWNLVWQKNITRGCTLEQLDSL